jgi:gas vesicle protein
MKTEKALLGVFAGLVAGAAIGVLFAPEKGSTTRRNISKKGEDLANALSDKIDDKFDELVNAISRRGRKSEFQNDVSSVKQKN